MRIAAALTISVSRNPQAHGPQDCIERSAAEVFDRPQPATGETFSSLFTMLLKLLLYDGVLQPIRNLLPGPAQKSRRMLGASQLYNADYLSGTGSFGQVGEYGSSLM